MQNQALLDAVNQAIKALEEVRRELERAETAPQAAAQEVPAPQSAPAERPVPQTTQMMRKAASLASAVCQQWKFQDEADVVNVSLLEYSSGEQDALGVVDPDDPESYYIVSPDGAIGMTEDDGETVEWLYLPLHRTVASMPKTLVKGEPWPEAVTIPAPQAAPAQAAPAAAGGVCPNCGRPVNPGSKFCMGCGTPVQAGAPAPAQAAPQGAFCQSCGAPLKPGDKFCMKCGANA